jgi:hypothetical protein
VGGGGGNQAHHATRHRRDQRRRWAVETSSRWRRFRIHSDGDSLSRRWAAGGACSLRGTRSSPGSCSSARCAANREKRELERAVLRQREAGCRSGDTEHCVSHGGGRRCQHAGCPKAAQTGGTPHCQAHGGGRRCQQEFQGSRSTSQQCVLQAMPPARAARRCVGQCTATAWRGPGAPSHGWD